MRGVVRSVRSALAIPVHGATRFCSVLARRQTFLLCYCFAPTTLQLSGFGERDALTAPSRGSETRSLCVGCGVRFCAVLPRRILSHFGELVLCMALELRSELSTQLLPPLPRTVTSQHQRKVDPRFVIPRPWLLLWWRTTAARGVVCFTRND